MIRAGEEVSLPGPSRLRTGEGDGGADRQPRGSQPSPSDASGEPAFIYREPGSPAGSGAFPEEDQAAAYGPDDPAYGPPSADWYGRDEQAGQAAAEAAARDLRDARGPFEPLRHPGGSGQEPSSGQPVGYGAGEDDPAGGATRALEQIKDFYLTAEAIGPENLDRHIGQLLERQQQLISDYFTEAALQESHQ